MSNGSKFFPDYGGFDTGNPLLNIFSGFAEKEEEEEPDPFDIDVDVAGVAPAAPAAPAAPVQPAAAPVRTLQKKELINKERRQQKEAEDKAKGAATTEKGRGAGGGTTTGTIQTYSLRDKTGGFKKGRKVGNRGSAEFRARP